MSTIRTQDILGYILLPRFKARFKGLFLNGFHYVPYFMALVYACVRLLPPSHPYLQSQNIGRFGIRHVIAEAANNLSFKGKNIDQILLFALMLVGISILFIQIAFIAMSLFMQPVMAAATPLTQMLIAPDPQQDLAYIMMDMVFGIEGLFGSCVSLSDVACQGLNADQPATLPGSYPDGQGGIITTLEWPMPVHNGLHKLLAFYNNGLLVIGILITCYFIATILAETMSTGTPFGKRFNKVWAPIRVLLAFTLLVPFGNNGLNLSQYVVLNVAKYGSGFASRGWYVFNDTLTGEYQNQYGNQMIGAPKIPEVGSLLRFMFLARTCAEAYKYSPSSKVEYKITKTVKDGNKTKEITTHSETIQLEVAPYLIRGGFSQKAVKIDLNGILDEKTIDKTIPYEDFIKFANGNNRVTLRFGVKDPDKFENSYDDPKSGNSTKNIPPGLKKFIVYPGGVSPICGDLTLRITDPRPSIYENGANPSSDEKYHYAEIGTEILQRYYWYVVKELWSSYGMFDIYKESQRNYPLAFVQEYSKSEESIKAAGGKLPLPDSIDGPKGTGFIEYLQGFYSFDLQDAIKDYTFPEIEGARSEHQEGALKAMQESGTWAFKKYLASKGWGGAAIWYNKIAEMNGAMTSAVLNIPMPARYPFLLEFAQEKTRQYSEIDSKDPFKMPKGDDSETAFPSQEDHLVYKPTYEAYKYWTDSDLAATSHTQPTGNIFIDTINALFGTSGIYSMKDNPDTHPVAQLVGIGRSLVDSSINNLGYAAMGGVAGYIGGSIIPGLNQMGAMASGFLITVAMIGLTAGFILFYVVPFIPFIYFFFALGGWVKGVFEAMVGAPLWALAHIRIDGEGLMGSAATNGYFLIFEIFLRPILILFGFLASIATFSASVSILNDLFPLVSENVGGFDVESSMKGEFNFENFRGPIDEFFFTVVYAVLVYLMLLPSAKLIDQIPNQILRWMGQQVSTFNDSREDPAKSLMGTATMGAQQVTKSMGGALKSAVGTLSSGGKG